MVLNLLNIFPSTIIGNFSPIWIFSLRYDYFIDIFIIIIIFIIFIKLIKFIKDKNFTKNFDSKYCKKSEKSSSIIVKIIVYLLKIVKFDEIVIIKWWINAKGVE